MPEVKNQFPSGTSLAGIAGYQAITSFGDMRGLESAEKAEEKTSQMLEHTTREIRLIRVRSWTIGLLSMRTSANRFWSLLFISFVSHSWCPHFEDGIS
jgi:hypothetical protein